jgi:nucleoid-associated protein YgaU
MISSGFKVFLLIVLFSGALWAYRFRARDLRAWLEFGEPPALPGEELPGLRSPVDRVLDPRQDARFLAALRYQAPRPPVPEEPVEELVLADLPPRFPEEPVRDIQPPAPAVQAAENPAAVEEEKEPILIHLPPAEKKAASDQKGGSRPTSSASEKEREKKEGGGKAEKAARARTPEKRPEKSEKPEKPASERPGNPRSDSRASPGEEGEPPEGPARLVDENGGSRRRVVSHVVRPKETLASLARRYYQNDTERWKVIFAANQERIADPDNLPLGLVIDIPDVAGERPEAKPARGQKPAARTAAPRATTRTAAQRPAEPEGLGLRKRGANG